MRQIRRVFLIILSLCLLASNAQCLTPTARAASNMTASVDCIDFIKQVEGFSAQPYFDYSQYTVGYGTKCPTIKFYEYKTNGISKKEAEELLLEEVAQIESDLNEKFIDKYNLTFSQHQFDALVSFSFNIGTKWITYNSTLRDAILNHADENEMVYAFGLYCTAGGKYLPGLVSRRLCEANMYLNGAYSKVRPEEYGYVYYDANGGTVDYRVQAFVCGSNAAPAADAACSGKAFSGWYTDLTGGTQINTLDRTLTGKTLFAHWQSPEDATEENISATTIKVTGDVVNIRSGPGTNYGTVKQVYRNTVLTVTHVTHLTTMKWGKVENGWICLDYTNYDAVIDGADQEEEEPDSTPSEDVTLPDDDPAWTDQDSTTDTPTDNQSVVEGYVNVNDFLNIRSGPGATYPSVGFLFRNTKVRITEQKTVGAMTWGRIEKGWISMDYIVTEMPSTNDTPTPTPEQEPEKEPSQEIVDSVNKSEAVAIKGIITADALRIRSGPGTKYSIMGFYYQDEAVTVSERVQVGSVYWGKTNKGWISMEYVQTNSTGGESAGEESAPATDGEKKTIIADCLRIRKEAGTEYKIVGFLYTGDQVTVSETKDVDGTLWGKTSKGWICMQYVK